MLFIDVATNSCGTILIPLALVLDDQLNSSVAEGSGGPVMRQNLANFQFRLVSIFSF
jgi:hypothetical protein